MTGAIRSWRGIRFAYLDHPFAAPSVADMPSPPELDGPPGASPIQRHIEGIDLGAPTDTDCLFLNVYAPHGDGPYPVLVWVYGGGFEMGSASAAWLDPAPLVDAAGCIVVMANYRLGAYGFGQFSPIDTSLADAHNLGLRDVLTALRWVKRNISAFGGDADQITIGGQSSGGFLAAAAAVAPDAPTVRALACFSGGASRIIREEDAERFASEIIDQPPFGGVAERLLRAGPADILAAQSAVVPTDLAVRNGARPRGFGIAIDATSDSPLVPIHPLDRVIDGALRDTFVLAAATVDEMEGFDPSAVPAVDGRTLAEATAGLAGDVSDATLKAYALAGARDSSWRQVLTDYIYRLPAARLVRDQLNAGGRATYLDISREDGTAAGHGSEHAGLFGAGSGPRADAVRRIMVDLVRHGTLPDDGLDGAVVAGEKRPDAVMDPSTLLSVWEGVARP